MPAKLQTATVAQVLILFGRHKETWALAALSATERST